MPDPTLLNLSELTDLLRGRVPQPRCIAALDESEKWIIKIYPKRDGAYEPHSLQETIKLPRTLANSTLTHYLFQFILVAIDMVNNLGMIDLHFWTISRTINYKRFAYTTAISFILKYSGFTIS